MKKNFFKFRGRFDFSPHPYEIGRPIFRNEGAGDNFFLLKVYQLSQADYLNFYRFHMEYFTDTYPGEERLFFETVTNMISMRIKYYQLQNPFSRKHPSSIRSITILQLFQKSISVLDNWHSGQELNKVLIEKDLEIERLRAAIDKLEKELTEISRYEPNEKISISRGNLIPFMDILRQMRNLTLANGNKLLSYQEYSSWYKLVSKYFMHGDKDIPMATAQNYFSPESSSKFTHIEEKHKLYEITNKS